MSNVVQFLEALARNPKPLSAEDIAAVVADAALEPCVQKAVLAGDAASLNDAIGGRATMLCFIAPAENDEPQRDDDQQEDQPEEDSPSRDPATQAA
jgi:hypothetical protein